MIFVGDIAVSEEKYAALLDKRLRENSSIFSGQDLIINLEGLVMDDFSTNQNHPILFNHSSVLPVLEKWNCKVAALANNHTLDRSECYENTKNKLKQYNIKNVGAALSREGSYDPVSFESDGKHIILFNQCWSVMLQHQKNPSQGVHVATIDSQRLIDQVSKTKKKFPEAAIVIYFHWNFDLETIPFPADRELSRQLIDKGADLVVGCHAHCVQGGERYKNGYIVYGLGNFFVPWYTFINGHISFPEFAKIEMVLEWNPNSKETKVHFFKYNPDNDEHQLHLLESASFNNSNLLQTYSEYRNMTPKEYLKYFGKKRRKKFLVPIYKSYNRSFLNQLNDVLIISRIRLLRKLAQINVRKWNN